MLRLELHSALPKASKWHAKILSKYLKNYRKKLDYFTTTKTLMIT
jgi:hypothetical protein